jgi:hypothetical protein
MASKINAVLLVRSTRAARLLAFTLAIKQAAFNG